MDLSGKVAVVTGGASGIGLSIVKMFLENGVSVALMDQNKENGEEVKKQLQEKYGEKKVEFFRCNVAIKEEFQGAVKDAVDKFSRMDIFVNNAGIAKAPQWEYVIEVNLIGLMRGTEEAAKYMSKEKGGSGGVVVNIASIAGLVPFAESAPYVAAKHGVIGFTRSLGGPEAYKASGIRHITVCPGLTATELTKETTPEVLKALEETLKLKMIMQKPENVAACVLESVKRAPSGSVWVVEDEEPAYVISIPDYKDLKVTPDQ